MEDKGRKITHIAVFTGGLAPDAADTAQYWEHEKPDLVIAADSGLDTCAKYNEYFADGALRGAFTPSVAVGDFDSVSMSVSSSANHPVVECFLPPSCAATLDKKCIETTIAAIPTGCEVEKCDAAKDLSDTEIALRRAYRMGEERGMVRYAADSGRGGYSPTTDVHITLVGGDGGRLDHLLAIYDTFSTPYHAHTWLLREQKALYVEDGGTAVLCGLHKGDIVSAARLMGNRTGGTFRTTGLVWGGEHFRTEGMPSLSNWAAGDGEVSIAVEGCAMLVMCPHWAHATINPVVMSGSSSNFCRPNLLSHRQKLYRDDTSAADDTLSRRLAFTVEIDKMTHILRRTMLIDGSRRENDAEHSWHIGMMALIFADYLPGGMVRYAATDESGYSPTMGKAVNKEHAAALCLAHDLVEIYAGDTFAFDKTGYKTKKAREEDAADRLFAMLPAGQADEVRGLWEEFEAVESNEAKLANCMDRLQPFLHNTLTAGHTWVEGGVKIGDVMERMHMIKEYMPSVWPWVETKVSEAMDKGWIETDDKQCEAAPCAPLSPAAVIFDMDGVLLDTESICDKTWVEAAPDFGLSPADAERALSECRGRNKADTLAALRGDFGDGFDAEGYINRTSELFHEVEEREGINVMRGAKRALQYLAGKGYRLSVASSTRGDTVRRQLETAGLLQFFETLTTGDCVTHSKPNPEIYLLAASSLSLPSASCVAIEDSPNGVRSARAAGMRCILVPDREKPTDEIRSISWRVLPSLEELGSVL